MRLIIIFSLLLFSLSINAEEIQPFISDGCSVFPDGIFTERELWLNCCTAHDYTYWQGGSYDDRVDADKALQQCVTKVGQPEIAVLMLAGVRVGGIPYINLKLIDEMIITKAQVLLGEGIPLFGKIEQPVKLKHAKSTTFANDFIQVNYNVNYL